MSASEELIMRSRLSETGKCVLEWSADGTVTKRLSEAGLADPSARRRFVNETRIAGLLTEDAPGLPFAALRSVEAAGSVLRFVAVEGEPLGPKWSTSLTEADVAGLLEICRAISNYAPAAADLQRFSVMESLGHHAAERGVAGWEYEWLSGLAKSVVGRLAFAHGDLTPRNVLRGAAGLVLIDWEDAGWYPARYDEAFLWVVLALLPSRRAQVARAIPAADAMSFWFCVYLLIGLHVSMYRLRPERAELLRELEERRLEARAVLRSLTAAADDGRNPC